MLIVVIFDSYRIVACWGPGYMFQPKKLPLCHVTHEDNLKKKINQKQLVVIISMWNSLPNVSMQHDIMDNFMLLEC